MRLTCEHEAVVPYFALTAAYLLRAAEGWRLSFKRDCILVSPLAAVSARAQIFFRSHV